MATKRPAPLPRRYYGMESLNWPGGIEAQTQLQIEMIAFIKRWPIESGGLRRVEHYHNILKILFPAFVPDRDDHWAQRQDETLCEVKWLCWAGCAGSAKTCRASLYAVVWWICAPEWSSVILSSTTGKAMRKRAWAEVRKFYSLLPLPHIGNMLDSRTMWQARKGDDKHAIVGVAVNEGPVEKAIDDIKGVHTERQLLLIDEATSTPEAMFGAFCNLQGYPDDFQVVVIGNPWSHMDEMGKFAEPVDGWKSVGIDTLEWETTPKLDGQNGLCVRFDAHHCPNILHNRVVNAHLITAAKLRSAARMGESSPKYWSEIRGFWPPDGLNRTVFTESLLQDKDGYGKHIFSGKFKLPCAACDPAFGGGDHAILQFGETGELQTGKTGLQLGDVVELTIDAASPKTIHYQLALQIKAQCERRGVKPAQFGIDASGEGGGLAAIIEREWGRGIHWVEFGGKPGELPFSEVDSRRACDLYDRRVTELWHIARELLQAGQLKGLSLAAAFEFCHRLFTDEKFKIILETKAEMKKRMSNRSPDHADAVVVLIETARQNGLQILSDTAREIDSEWQTTVAELNELCNAEGGFD